MADKKSRVMSHMGEVKERDKKPVKRHVHKMEIERGAHGGYVVHHHMKGGEKEHEGERTGPHVIPSHEDLQDHVADTMGDQPDAGAGQAPGGADPAAAAPAPGGDPAAAMTGQ